MTTVSVISAGAMGSAIASVLSKQGFRILSTLKDRSASTVERAKEAGMQDSSLETIAKESKIILSVLPPSEAVALARKVVEACPSSSFSDTSTSTTTKPIYCDLNAISPETTKQVAQIVKHHFRFVDGSVIGGKGHKQ